MTFAALLATEGLAPVLAALPRARLVGGCVRDALAGTAIADVDLATPDPPEAVLAALSAARVRAIPTGLSHGTITALSGGRPFEITTLRRDESTDGRHAKVVWTEEFAEDAARRDFTINAMSLDQSGKLHDYFGGATDLAAGRVRFVGDAARRVAEDYLRILRFFRFYARYGSDVPDAQAVAAIAAGRDGLAGLSAERVWRELKSILSARAPSAALRLMDELGVLAKILPDGYDIGKLMHVIAAGAPADPLLRISALSAGDVDALAARLKMSSAERDHLSALQHGPTPTEADDDAALRRLLADEPASLLVDRLRLTGHDFASLRQRITDLPKPVFPLEGRDALALGASPGPQIGAALRTVREWWKQDGCVASRETLLERLRGAFGKEDLLF